MSEDKKCTVADVETGKPIPRPPSARSGRSIAQVGTFGPFRQGEVDEPGSVLRRDGSLQGNSAPISGVVECQSPGVQHEPAGAGFLLLRMGLYGVTDERVAEVQHVHTNLVGAAGMQRAHHQAGVCGHIVP